ncbi:MAG: YetF domain-containing protein, partial [Chthoniobacterales bacterium]
LIKGEPEVIVENGERQRAAMRRNHISDHDLEEDLRLAARTDDLSDVQVARIERSGDISFIKKQEA